MEFSSAQKDPPQFHTYLCITLQLLQPQLLKALTFMSFKHCFLLT